MSIQLFDNNKKLITIFNLKDIDSYVKSHHEYYKLINNNHVYKLTWKLFRQLIQSKMNDEINLFNSNNCEMFIEIINSPMYTPYIILPMQNKPLIIMANSGFTCIGSNFIQSRDELYIDIIFEPASANKKITTGSIDNVIKEYFGEPAQSNNNYIYLFMLVALFVCYYLILF